MKFKAALSEHGRHLLERRAPAALIPEVSARQRLISSTWAPATAEFLPCFERHGKVLRVLLSPEDVHLIQLPEDAESMRLVSRLAKSMVCEGNSWSTTSRHRDLIAFKLQIDHLRSALKAASNSNAEFVEIRLTTRKAGGEGTQAHAKPYLCLTSKGTNSNMTHDIPIGRVFLPDEIEDLFKHSQSQEGCPYYVDIQGEQMRLQGLVDTLARIDGNVSLVTTQQGFMYLQVAGPGVRLSSEVEGLDVVPLDARKAPPGRQLSTEQRLQEAVRNEWAHHAVVPVKLFGKSLHSSQVATPKRLLLGISESRSHVQFMFAFPSQIDDDTNWDVMLSYQLPVLDEGDWN